MNSVLIKNNDKKENLIMFATNSKFNTANNFELGGNGLPKNYNSER